MEKCKICGEPLVDGLCASDLVVERLLEKRVTTVQVDGEQVLLALDDDSHIVVHISPSASFHPDALKGMYLLTVHLWEGDGGGLPVGIAPSTGAHLDGSDTYVPDALRLSLDALVAYVRTYATTC